MNTFSKIAGILLTVSAVVGIAFALYFIVIYPYDRAELNATSFAYLIPCTLVLFYMFLHNFGFNLKSETSRIRYKTILVLTITTLLVAGIVPNLINLEPLALYKKHKFENFIDRGDYVVERVGKAINYSLKTKLVDGKLFCVLDIETVDKSRIPMMSSATIEFTDKDGFSLSSCKLSKFSWKEYKGVKYGLTSNNVVSNGGRFSLEDYSEISGWEVSTKME